MNYCNYSSGAQVRRAAPAAAAEEEQPGWEDEEEGQGEGHLKTRTAIIVSGKDEINGEEQTLMLSKESFLN